MMLEFKTYENFHEILHALLLEKMDLITIIFYLFNVSKRLL